MINKEKEINKGEIVIYKNKRSKINLDVKLENETVWLTQKQMAELFGKDIRTINDHIKNVFKVGELKEKSVIRKFRITAPDGKHYITNFYNLDMVISVGYRVNSKQGVDFRIWATQKIKEYLINGYVINQERIKTLDEKRFNEFKRVIEITKGLVIEGDEAKGVLSIIAEYADTWMLLQNYDENTLPEPKKKKAKFVLDYDFASMHIGELKNNLLKKSQATDLFGRQRDNLFDGVIGAIKQSFSGQELYPTIEDKAPSSLFCNQRPSIF